MYRGRDLAAARRSLAAFARAVGWPLAPWQSDALRLEARTSYVLGPRQTGKSRGVAVLAAWRAYREPDHHVLIVSASELGAKRLLATVAQVVTSSPLLSASVIDEHSSLIVLSNRSTIRSLPSSSRALRGWSADTLLLDEATEQTDECIDLVLPTTAARPDARVVFLSTAGAPIGRAFETFMAGLDRRSPLVRSYTWKLRDAKWIGEAVIEHARLTMPPWRFASEYGEPGTGPQWLGAADAWMPPDVQQRVRASLDVPVLRSLHGPAQAMCGLDSAASGPDRSAVCGIARLVLGPWNPHRDPNVPVYLSWPLRHFPPGYELAAVVDEIVASPASWRVVSSEVNGVGAGPSQMLRSRLAELTRARRDTLVGNGEPWAWLEERGPVFNPVFTTWQRKADALGRMRVLCERGQLLLGCGGEAGAEFMKQIAAAKIEHRQASTGIEAAFGHDDLLDAAYLATCSYTVKRTGELRNELDRLARRRMPEASIPPEAVDVETVEAGDLIVPRSPWLQSVNGTAVTPPSNVQALTGEAEHPAIRKARERVGHLLRK